MNTRKITQEYRMNNWIKIIHECHNSGQTVTSWCKNNDVNTKTYYYWLRKIRTAACIAMSSADLKQQIVPLDMSKLQTSASSYASSETTQADITIRIGSAVLEIRNNASVSLIENVIRVLKNDR